MQNRIRQFNEIVDQLTLWLREYGDTVTIPASDKRRARLALGRIIGEISEDDPYSNANQAIAASKSEIEKRKPLPNTVSAITGRDYGQSIVGSGTTLQRQVKPAFKESSVDRPKKKKKRKRQPNLAAPRSYTVCKFCSASVVSRRIAKHYKRCPKNDEVQAANANGTGSRVTGKVHKGSVITFGRDQVVQQRENKRLDGAYGTHVFRENGRFGSMPSYDDHGEEAIL